MARIHAFIEPHTQLGESPLYREADNTLHYVDVVGQRIIILNLSDLHRCEIYCPERVTFLAFHKDGGYIVCSFSSIVRVSDDGTWRILVRVIQDTTIERLNDGGIDSHGRLWVGSIDRFGEWVCRSYILLLADVIPGLYQSYAVKQ